MRREILEKALEISLKRRRILDEMRRALQARDKETVFSLALKLTGLSDEKCHRTDPRLN
jgi:hypothetical protein